MRASRSTSLDGQALVSPLCSNQHATLRQLRADAKRSVCQTAGRRCDRRQDRCCCRSTSSFVVAGVALIASLPPFVQLASTCYFRCRYLDRCRLNASHARSFAAVSYSVLKAAQAAIQGVHHLPTNCAPQARRRSRRRGSPSGRTSGRIRQGHTRTKKKASRSKHVDG